MLSVSYKPVKTEQPESVCAESADMSHLASDFKDFLHFPFLARILAVEASNLSLTHLLGLGLSLSNFIIKYKAAQFKGRIPTR